MARWGHRNAGRSGQLPASPLEMAVAGSGEDSNVCVMVRTAMCGMVRTATYVTVRTAICAMVKRAMSMKVRFEQLRSYYGSTIRIGGHQMDKRWTLDSSLGASSSIHGRKANPNPKRQMTSAGRLRVQGVSSQAGPADANRGAIPGLGVRPASGGQGLPSPWCSLNTGGTPKSL